MHMEKDAAQPFILSEMRLRSLAKLATAVCSISTSSSVHFPPTPPGPPSDGSCCVSWPSVLKASPAAENISPTLDELALIFDR